MHRIFDRDPRDRRTADQSARDLGNEPVFRTRLDRISRVGREYAQQSLQWYSVVTHRLAVRRIARHCDPAGVGTSEQFARGELHRDTAGCQRQDRHSRCRRQAVIPNEQKRDA